jgi:hypothetical protein
LLVCAIEGEGSPIIDIVGDASKGPLPEASMASSSSDASLVGAANDVADESASSPLVGFGVLNDNLIKCLISFVEVHEQIISNRYKGIHGYITQSTIMMQMELCDQCV